jgi:hypothetical protein
LNPAQATRIRTSPGAGVGVAPSANTMTEAGPPSPWLTYLVRCGICNLMLLGVAPLSA